MINPICSSSARRDDPRSRAVFVATAFAIALTVLAHVALAIEPLEDAVEQKFDLDADATLNVANTDGSIRIYGSDTSVISIVAIKKAYTPERLEGIVVDVKATRKSVTIATTFPPRKSPVSDKSGTVDYIIVAPQGIRITQLNLINGELLVEGLRGGGATAHLVNGWLGGHNCFADLDLPWKGVAWISPMTGGRTDGSRSKPPARAAMCVRFSQVTPQPALVRLPARDAFRTDLTLKSPGRGILFIRWQP